MEKNKNTLSYCKYGGAVGDGVHDDFLAMKKTHEMANITGKTVVADHGKKFNVGIHKDTIPVKTDVDWTDAEIIIDDSSILPSNTCYYMNIFSIVRDRVPYKVKSLKSLKAGQKNIGLKFSNKVLLHITDASRRQYIRYGLNVNKGSAVQEIIIIDNDGNVDASTPIMWDYDTVTDAECFYIDDKPITISGGTVITVANNAPRTYEYCARGIEIKRSNVTIKNQKHLVVGEGDEGNPYRGMYSAYYCNNFTMENCVLTGHKKYPWSNDARNMMGTYELGGYYVNNIMYKNITQTNDINDDTYWGVMGTNYCKNITYDGCRLSRFDAHQGVYNAVIKNSELGWQKLCIIGSGKMTVENSVFHGNSVVLLRTDFGSTWNGDVLLKNITIKNTDDTELLRGHWVNHDFGYTCYLPRNIIIDGITLADKTKKIYVLGEFSSNKELTLPVFSDGTANRNPYVPPESVTVIRGTDNNVILISKNTAFSDVKMEIK